MVSSFVFLLVYQKYSQKQRFFSILDRPLMNLYNYVRLYWIQGGSLWETVIPAAAIVANAAAAQIRLRLHRLRSICF